MLNPMMLLTALILFVFSPAPGPKPLAQDATPTPSAAPTKKPAKTTPESQAKAKKLYAVDCAMCHGDNGNGKTDLATGMALTMPNWTDAKSLAGKPDQDLFDTIRKGKDKMPPEDSGRAKDDAVWNLIIYIRGFAK
jgi:mono/diheme cytochrome c family protein